MIFPGLHCFGGGLHHQHLQVVPEEQLLQPLKPGPAFGLNMWMIKHPNSEPAIKNHQKGPISLVTSISRSTSAISTSDWPLSMSKPRSKLLQGFWLNPSIIPAQKSLDQKHCVANPEASKTVWEPGRLDIRQCLHRIFFAPLFVKLQQHSHS